MSEQELTEIVVGYVVQDNSCPGCGVGVTGWCEWCTREAQKKLQSWNAAALSPEHQPGGETC